MKRCKIEIALKARRRLSLLAAAVTLSGAFFSAHAQEPIKIGFGVSLTGGLASSGKAHLMSKLIRGRFASLCAVGIFLNTTRQTPATPAFLVAKSGHVRYISGHDLRLT